MKLLQIDLQHDSALNHEQVRALDRLSIQISGTPGFVWKTFSKNQRDGTASGVYVFEDEYSAQLYSCRFALQMSALGTANIQTEIHDVGSGMHADIYGDGIELLFSPSHASWHRDEISDLVA